MTLIKRAQKQLLNSPQAWYGKQRVFQPSSSASSEYSLRGSPTRHARSSSGGSHHGGSHYGGATPGTGSKRQPSDGRVGEASPGRRSASSSEQRKLQRQLLQQQQGVLPPPEKRYLQPASRRGSDEAARHALMAHLAEVEACTAQPPLLLLGSVDCGRSAAFSATQLPSFGIGCQCSSD